jgi:AcrR family transcriptional regulator
MAESHASSQPIWERPAPATRQPRFSRAQIANAALRIADADGFEAVSMRRIAAMLGSGTMSLYRYLETKAELLDLMDDALLGETLVPGDLPADWRDALALIARQTRRVYLRHPWAVQALQGRSAAERTLAGPNALRHFEQCLAALDSAPLAAQAKLDLLAIVDDYVIGHLLRAAEVTGRGPGGVPAEIVEAQQHRGEYPHLDALTDDPGIHRLADASHLEDRFELGLRLLIDGMSRGRSRAEADA